MPFRTLALTCALAALAACDGLSPGKTPQATVRPAPTAPSQDSENLRRHYAHVQADLLARGLLRTDGGGPDTPYTADMLAKNFERIAFYDEYARGGGLRRSSGRAGQLRRWTAPIRVSMRFGPSVPDTVQTADRALVNGYLGRLASVTGHPITASQSRANFHVLVMGLDDQAALSAQVKQIIPGASTSTLNLFRNVPRSIHCLVVAFSDDKNENKVTSAIALIRAEHPDLLRKSCYHEEIAQGLGLANDSPDARPSIFNDADEFALLTTHDEALLAMLYDPRLSIGMPLEQARPIFQIMAREKAGRLY